MEYKTLNNGIKMPMVGLGVYNISERKTQNVVEDAISVGYRSIDCHITVGLPTGQCRSIRSTYSRPSSFMEWFTVRRVWSCV